MESSIVERVFLSEECILPVTSQDQLGCPIYNYCNGLIFRLSSCRSGLPKLSAVRMRISYKLWACRN